MNHKVGSILAHVEFISLQSNSFSKIVFPIDGGLPDKASYSDKVPHKRKIKGSTGSISAFLNKTKTIDSIVVIPDNEEANMGPLFEHCDDTNRVTIDVPLLTSIFPSSVTFKVSGHYCFTLFWYEN